MLFLNWGICADPPSTGKKISLIEDSESAASVLRDKIDFTPQHLGLKQIWG
jgi:hypothetical protein